MKLLKLLQVVSIAVLLSTVIVLTNFAEVPAKITTIQIKTNFTPDPLVLNGKSGGQRASNCGNISASPNHIIQLTESVPYMRFTVEGDGQPTLLIDGPGGRFCTLSDAYSRSKLELSGYWQAGNYSLYVGEVSARQYNYTLSISQQQKLK